MLVCAGNQNSFRWKSWVFRFRSSSLGLVLERNAIVSHATVSLTLTSTWSLCWLRSLLLNQEMKQIRPHRPHTPCSPPCWGDTLLLQHIERGSVKNKLGIALQWFERAATLFQAKSVLHLLPVCTTLSTYLCSICDRRQPADWLRRKKYTVRTGLWSNHTDDWTWLNLTDYKPVLQDVLLCGLFLNGWLHQESVWRLANSRIKDRDGVNFNMQYLLGILTTSDLLWGLLVCVFATHQPYHQEGRWVLR